MSRLWISCVGLAAAAAAGNCVLLICNGVLLYRIRKLQRTEQERAAELRRLTEVETERILAMTDAEVIAYCEAHGEDPAAVAEHVRAIFKRAQARVDGA
ncbi:MAG TPA: hypothetical protein VK741_21745 [Acetobacteraceae bacterium]|jgi:hypothetical protein|nr:hypothetical protein [Acetobacteraceae bacterium]